MLDRVRPRVVGLGVVVAAVSALTAVPAGTVARGAQPATVTIAAAGDIYSYNCTSGPCPYDQTADAVVALNPTAALVLGDLDNEAGAAADYAGPINASWGRFKNTTSPVPGNHDYFAPNAGNYFAFFGAAAHPPGGYYSLNLGAWHIVALNSNCADVGGCQRGSPQEQWLRTDLAANSSACTLAFWHAPRYSSTGGGNQALADFWQDLYDARADVVLSGHAHNYERFAPQNNAAGLDPKRGLTQFVVGTGGASHGAFGTPQPNSLVRESSTFGVLAMTLGPGWYDFRFRPVAGKTFTDTGTATCHAASGAAATVPTAPTGLTATDGDGRVDLSWSAPANDGGSAVVRYMVYRSTVRGARGQVLGIVTGTTFADTGVTNGVTYYYEVAAGNAVGDGPESTQVSAAPHGMPRVTLTAGPAAATNRTDATFAFTTSDPLGLPVTTTCRLDAQPASPCASGQSYRTLANGGHTLTVTARDAAGLSGGTSYRWLVDTVRPTAVLTAPTRPFMVRPVVASWTGRDFGSGVASYTLRYRQVRYDGRFSAWLYPSSWARLTAPRVTAPAPPGYTRCFSVRSRDRAGNLSPWSPQRCTAVPLDDRALAAAGGWTRTVGAAYYRFTATTTRSIGATLVRRSASATQIALVATRCPGCGTVRVSFGGRTVATVRLYSTRLYRQQVIPLPRFALRSGTVTIRVVSSGRVVQIDGLGMTRA